ncbi:histidine kinase [uncultured Microbacterium sp.]|uniref:histidine kinase n=1 Tax=uncultured Microbacterium sp. TaxID=191216 RepID=UPI0028DCF50E|nr:histidine kinase [uncultured Microbacterium sp.]
MTDVADSTAHTGPWQRWGWLMAVVWMVFLVYPVLALLQSNAEVGWVALGWVALVCFAVVYVVGFVAGMRAEWGAPSRLVRTLFWAQIACAVATIPAIDTRALSFLPYLMSYASYGLRGVWHWATTLGGIAVAAGVIVVTGRFAEHFQILAIVLLIAVVNTVNSWLIGRSVDADRVRVQLATSEERTSIARDVHDLLGHTLTAVKLKAELAERLVDADPARAKAELAEIVHLTGEAIAGVRSTVTGLRGAALGEQVRASSAALRSAGVDVEVAGDPAALSPAQSLPAGWIVREATTNVLRHADASRVRIAMAPGEVVVEDDGRGVRGGGAGNGMRGMAERAGAAGAVLAVDEVPGGGTRVSVTW